MNLENDVREVLGRYGPEHAANLDLATPLGDLGIESLDVIDIIFSLEERFDINLPFEANAADGNGLATIGDLVNLVAVELKARDVRAAG